MSTDDDETVRMSLILRRSMRGRIQVFRLHNSSIVTEMDAIRRLLEIALDLTEKERK